MIPQIIYNMGTNILRAVGDSKRPLYFLLIASLVNIVLDIVFVAGFKWGVAGAALATIISQLASAVLTLRCLAGSNGMPWHLETARMRPDPAVLSDIQNYQKTETSKDNQTTGGQIQQDILLIGN